MSLSIQVDDSAVLAALNAIESAVENIEPVAAEAAQLHLMEHLAAKDAGPHKTASRLGAEPSGLYADFARALTYTTAPGQVDLAINHAAAPQRFYGGIIKPVNSKYLTIPVAKESYGKSLGAGDFTDKIIFLFGKDRKPYGAALESDPSHLLYILTKSVTQSADPTVLPSDADLTANILQTLSDALDLETP